MNSPARSLWWLVATGLALNLVACAATERAPIPSSETAPTPAASATPDVPSQAETQEPDGAVDVEPTAEVTDWIAERWPVVEWIESHLEAEDYDAAHAALESWVVVDGAVVLDLLLTGLDEERAEELLRRVDKYAWRTDDPAIGIEAVRRLHSRLAQRFDPDDVELLDLKRILAGLCADVGDDEEALRLDEELVAHQQRTLSEDDPVRLKDEANLARSLRRTGELEGARAILESVLERRERALAADDPLLLQSRLELARVHVDLGADESARVVLERAIRDASSSENRDVLQLAELEVLLADVLARTGDPANAIALCEHAHTTYEAHLSDEDRTLLSAKAKLARLHLRCGDVTRALFLDAQVLECLERTSPANHRDIIIAKINLATSRYESGDVVGAMDLDESVHAALTESGDSDHADLFLAKVNLATTREAMGDLVGALELEEQAVAGYERCVPIGHPELLMAKGNLAMSRAECGDIDGALELLVQVLEVEEKLLPPEHPELLSTKSRLAKLHSRLGNTERAAAIDEAVFMARQRTLPAMHPDLLHAEESLASSLLDQGDVTRALQLTEHVLEVREETLPSAHPDLIRAKSNLAATLARAGDLTRLSGVVASVLDAQVAVARASCLCAPRLARTAAQREIQRLEFLTAWSEQLAEAGFQDHTPRLVEALESLRLVSTASAVTARATAVAPRLDALRIELARVRRAIADTSRTVPSSSESLDRWRKRLFELCLERDGLERELRLQLDDSGSNLDMPTTQSIAASLADGAIHIGFWRCQRLRESEQGSSSYEGEDGLLAFLVTSEGATTCVDLGRAVELEARVDTWRRALGRPIERGIGTEAEALEAESAAGRSLREALLDPILAALGGEAPRVLHVVPDDLVYLVPLDSLPFNDGSRVGDTVKVRLDSSVARLVQARRAPRSQGTLVALGGVDYRATDLPNPGHGVAVSTARTAATTFEPLLASGIEAEFVATLFEEHVGGRAELTRGKAATEAALVELAPRARYLHIATHGWFVPESAAVSMLDKLGEGASEELRLSVDRAQDTIVGFLPETLCGLALAGANNGPDGILTAEELATLDLTNCELAVLSACETNVGIRRAGQGIQSLQTALHAAGARTAITSLWKVDDAATRRLFELFYTKLWSEKLGPADALWQAKMALRSEGHPTRDWAGWVLTGDPD
jgi:CHAT domain-containing protein/tetratricopeptide (TPR) repeat protein